MSETRLITWLTVQEASEKTGVSGQYIRRLLLRGDMVGELRGNTWLIHPGAVEQFIRDRKSKIKEK